MFLEADRFCVRMCTPTISRDLQKAYCPHKYDELGCARDPADFIANRLRRVERAVELRPWLRLMHRRQRPAAGSVPAAWRLALHDLVQGLVDLRSGPEADAVAASRTGLVQVHDLLAAGALDATARSLTVQTYTKYGKAQKAAGATATPKPKQTNTKGKRDGTSRRLRRADSDSHGDAARPPRSRALIRFFALSHFKCCRSLPVTRFSARTLGCRRSIERITRCPTARLWRERRAQHLRRDVPSERHADQRRKGLVGLRSGTG